MTAVLAVLGAVIVALVVVVAVILLSSGDDDPFPTTTTGPGTTASPGTTAPSTTLPETTTTAPTTTTTSSTTTTTAATTTTTEPFSGDTFVKGTLASSGDPGPLTDMRIGDHAGFTRIVLDFEGDGEHWWEVGYGDVFGGGSGEVCQVGGAVTLGVMAQPASAFWVEQTYFGPTEFGPDFESSVVEVVYCDDFEAVLQIAIGVDGEKPFDAFVLQDPLRLVIDIAD